MACDFIARPLDLLLGFTPGMTLPKVNDPSQRQWHPEDALAIPVTHTNYGPDLSRVMNGRTASEDAWTRWRRAQVVGVRWDKGLKKCALQEDDDIKREAAAPITEKLIRSGELDLSDLTPLDADRAEDAITVLISIAHDGTCRKTDRINAAKAILDFTRAKPAQKQDIKVSSALAWLDDAEAQSNQLLGSDSDENA